VLAPERNREHSIGDQVAALNVGFMERLQCCPGAPLKLAEMQGQNTKGRNPACEYLKEEEATLVEQREQMHDPRV
jgi:hypothetical protein